LTVCDASGFGLITKQAFDLDSNISDSVKSSPNFSLLKINHHFLHDTHSIQPSSHHSPRRRTMSKRQKEASSLNLTHSFIANKVFNH
jgi:hypothetical protein